MPLYELFCLARPQLQKTHLADIIRKAGVAVFDKGGVVTDIKSFGDRKLAYDIRKPSGKYSEAAMWEMTFLVEPSALKEVEHELRVDERVLRWLFVKKETLPVLPNTFRLNRHLQAETVPQLHNPWDTLKAQAQRLDQRQPPSFKRSDAGPVASS